MMSRIVGAIAIVVALVACGGDSSSDRPGSPAVYASIDAETDCAALQAAFDQAEANHQRATDRGALELAKIDTSYMVAAEDRRQELGC